MAEIMKGIVTSFVGDQVAVKPYNSEDTVSPRWITNGGLAATT